MTLSLTSQQINGIGLSSSLLSLLRQSYDGIVFWVGRAGFLFTLALSMLILWPLSALVVTLLKKLNNTDIELTSDNLDKYWKLYMNLKNSLDDYNKVKNYNIQSLPFFLKGVVGSLKKMASLQVDIYHKIDKVFADLDNDATDDFFTKIAIKEIMEDRPTAYKYVI